MMRARIAIAALAVLALAGPAAADTAGLLRDANAALGAGDWQRAEQLARALTPPLEPADRAEAHRILGLAAFFLGRLADAERELLAYMKLDLDARLDPAVTPPEALTFFEDVRARHAAELRALRPRPRRSLALNLLPPFGQIQNGDRGKAWAIGGGVVLAAANITSFVFLRRWCSADDRTCGDHTEGAQRLRAANWVTGGALIALYAYGVIDGLVGTYQYRREADRTQIQVVPIEAGGLVVVGGQF